MAAFLKEEEIGLTTLLTIAKSQSEAIKAKDHDKMEFLIQERERIGAKIESIYRDRVRAEERIRTQEEEKLSPEELSQLKEKLAKIASEIIEVDKSNCQEMKKRMGAIEKSFLAIERAKLLKGAYLEGIRGEEREPIFINKHQ